MVLLVTTYKNQLRTIDRILATSYLSTHAPISALQISPQQTTSRLESGLLIYHRLALETKITLFTSYLSTHAPISALQVSPQQTTSRLVSLPSTCLSWIALSTTGRAVATLRRVRRVRREKFILKEIVVSLTFFMVFRRTIEI